MEIEKALNVISQSLQSYIQDCSGYDTDETEEIEKAWVVINDALKSIKTN